MTTNALPASITPAIINTAHDSILRCGGWSRLNPTQPLSANPYFAASNQDVRDVFGTKNAVWYCDKCGVTNRRVHRSTTGIVTDCCNGTVIVDMPARAWAKFA